MPNHDDDADADWDDDWDDDSAEVEADDDVPTVPCPFCKRELLEDSPYCPACDRYLSAEDFARASRPPWVILTALVCLAMAIWLAFAL